MAALFTIAPAAAQTMLLQGKKPCVPAGRPVFDNTSEAWKFIHANDECKGWLVFGTTNGDRNTTTLIDGVRCTAYVVELFYKA